MADNYFDEEDGTDAGAVQPGDTSPGEAPEETGTEQTYALPKAIAGGKTFNVGDEMVVQIVAEHEDTFEVKYAPEKGSETPPEEAPMKSTEGAGAEDEMY